MVKTKSKNERKAFEKNVPYIEQTMRTIKVNNDSPSKQVREIEGASMYGRKMMLASNGHTTHIRYLSQDGKSMISIVSSDKHQGWTTLSAFTGKELGAEIITQKAEVKWWVILILVTMSRIVSQ